MLKGWLDRVFLPGVAFIMPKSEGEHIRPGLDQITHLGVFTTCGASWWLTRWIGAPGRRTLLRGVRLLCPKSCKTTFAAHYAMDSSTPQSRARHLDRVRRKMRRFLNSATPEEAVA
jgi:putative NADPH-quinone reductase